MISRTEMQAEALLILSRARADLGPLLGGYSAVDLLLDMLPGLRGSDDARALLVEIGDHVPLI